MGESTRPRARMSTCITAKRPQSLRNGRGSRWDEGKMRASCPPWDHAGGRRAGSRGIAWDECDQRELREFESLPAFDSLRRPVPSARPPWPPPFVCGASWLALGLLALPLVSLASTIALVVFGLVIGNRMRIVGVIGFALLEFAFVLFLIEWNLLGYRV